MATKLIVPKIVPNFLEGVWGPSCKGRLGMVFAPGRFKPNQPQIIRNLDQDMNILRNQYQVRTLVSLIEDHERPKLRITQKKSICQKLGIKYFSFPIQDYGVPQDQETFKKFVKKIVDQQIKREKTVLAHCKAGLGRTGLFATSCLVYSGLNPEEAIKLVRKTRPGTVQTESQVQFIRQLKF